MTTIQIELLSEDQSAARIQQMFKMLDMRPTLPRIERIVTVVTSLLAHHGNILTERQLQHLGRIIDECEEFLVLRFSRQNIVNVTGIIFVFHALYAEAYRLISAERDAELRERFRAHGLHGMHRRLSIASTSSLDEALCVVCMDAQACLNISDRCAHDPVLCAKCAGRLDTCPTCRIESCVAQEID